MANAELSPQVVSLLETIIGDNIDKFLVTNFGGNEKGEGYLSEFLILSLENKESHEKHDLVVKQSTSSSELLITCYLQEIYFYDTIWPRYLELQKTVPSFQPFDKIPRCLATDAKTEVKMLILENLTKLDFQLWDKKKEFSVEVAELIFQTYGKFHGFSFILKHLYPEQFLKLKGPVKEQSAKQVQQFQFVTRSVPPMLGAIKASYNGDKKEEIKEKLTKYAEKGNEIINNIKNYDGDNEVLLHGDCWSNNFMFKFDESGKPVDIRILDFQLITLGSPVHDLSQALYSGASKEALANLDRLQRAFHDSLSEVFKAFHCDPDIVYSFSTFQAEWKKYCVYGFLKGSLTWYGKLMLTALTPSIDELSKSKFETRQEQPKVDQSKYDQVVHALVWHMNENDFL